MIWFKRLLIAIACLAPWVLAVFAFVWVMRQHFPEDGRFAMSIPVDGRSPWFEAFLPGQRANAPGPQEGGWIGQRITDEPVYARLRLPGAYEEADVRIEFRPNGQPLLELGVERGTGDAASYELSPLWSQELASSTFRSIQTAQGPWWVRPGTTEAQLGGAEENRVFWHASGTVATAWMDQGPVASQTVSSSLRGTHDFWFVPVDGRIDVRFALQDMNRSAHHSTASFRLTRDQDLLWSDAISFGGQDDAKPSVLTYKTLAFKDLAPGAYRLSFLADDSIFIRAWQTTAKRWVIGPRVYFADEVGYSTSTPAVSVWTNSHHIEAKTLHKEGLQTLAFGSASTQALKETHVTALLSRASSERTGSVAFKAPKGNVWILGDGYVSWKQESLFFPNPRRLTDETKLDDEDIQAVATTYQAPSASGDGWYVGRIRVKLDPSQDRLKLVLAAPGIVRRGTAVDIRKFDVTYLRPPRSESWWEPLRQELGRAWRRW